MSDTASAHMWSVIVPVKLLADAKSRLHVEHGRSDLALAFFHDVLAAVLGAEPISHIVVVGDDPAVQAMVHQVADPRIDLVSQGPTPGLNPAIRHAAAQLPSQSRVAVIASDLPCLNSATLTMVLDHASTHPRAFVTDAQGIGTTMLCQTDQTPIEPAFGTRSRARHRQLGYRELPVAATDLTNSSVQERWARARRDVDTAVDLWDAERLGVGSATQRILRGPSTAPFQRLLTAGGDSTDGGIEAVTEDGSRLVIPQGVIEASPFRHLRPGQRVLAVIDDGLVTRIGLTGQLIAKRT
ncbi:MAG: 2-phospho-L-lactate guanylyltransferase [Actinomycetales bacterium]|nr:2-phospho-L-lactate guanylyltransferase [Actinomycetales bacterium]